MLFRVRKIDEDQTWKIRVCGVRNGPLTAASRSDVAAGAGVEKRQLRADRWCVGANAPQLRNALAVWCGEYDRVVRGIPCGAQASAVHLELSDTEGMLTLEITDNGLGFDPATLAKPRSFGLQGLRERARTVSGWLDVSSRPAMGTSVVLSVPLQRAPDDGGNP